VSILDSKHIRNTMSQCMWAVLHTKHLCWDTYYSSILFFFYSFFILFLFFFFFLILVDIHILRYCRCTCQRTQIHCMYIARVTLAGFQLLVYMSHSHSIHTKQINEEIRRRRGKKKKKKSYIKVTCEVQGVSQHTPSTQNPSTQLFVSLHPFPLRCWIANRKNKKSS
jgi:hypothetical protein